MKTCAFFTGYQFESYESIKFSLPLYIIAGSRDEAESIEKSLYGRISTHVIKINRTTGLQLAHRHKTYPQCQQQIDAVLVEPAVPVWIDESLTSKYGDSETFSQKVIISSDNSVTLPPSRSVKAGVILNPHDAPLPPMLDFKLNER